MAEAPTFFIAIPAYNEAARFPSYAAELAKEFTGRKDIAFLLVDDGSKAAERKACEAAAEKAGAPFIDPVALEENSGKGAAILHGWNQAGKSEWVGFVDADGSVTATELARVLEEVARAPGVDAWFASRVKMLGRTVERSLLRHLTGRIFATLVGSRIDPSVYDSQCGLKLVRRSVFEKIRDRLEEKGFAFDVDLLAGLNAVGARTVEIPVDWHHEAGSHVSFFRDSLRMFFATGRIRKRWKL